VDVKGRAFQKVLGPSVRAGMGQYFTPLEVIRFMVEVAAPTVSELVLDPFAGSGHFLTASLDLVRSLAKPGDAKRLDEFAFHKLHGIEKSDRMVRVAMTDMRLHGDGHSNVRCTDALLTFSNYPDLRPESFDVVLTNPPFGSLLGQEAISRLGKFRLAEGRASVPLEILGLERCLQFLRPGGRLGIVLPDGILVNRGTRGVREWLEEEVKLRALVSLPIETFTPYGANIKTSILFARKWKKGESRGGEYPVCLLRADDIGYDATGRVRSSSELGDAAGHLKAFLEKEGW
jgi:type I restriction enzyme M protein